jgi:hypothetical protein
MSWFGSEKGKRRKEKKERAAALTEIILKQGTTERSSEESKKAVAYCELCMTEYDDWFGWNEARWLRWQKVTIIGGVVATLAGVITIPTDWLTPTLQSFSWVRALPAAVATIAASYLGSFNYREDAVRHEITANALWNELAKFQARAAPYNIAEAKDTSAFMLNVCQLVEAELRSWGALVMGGHTEDEEANKRPEDDREGKTNPKNDTATQPPVSSDAQSKKPDPDAAQLK